MHLIAQKKELEAGFAMQRGELKADFQKQVDEMYFSYVANLLNESSSFVNFHCYHLLVKTVRNIFCTHSL